MNAEEKKRRAKIVTTMFAVYDKATDAQRMAAYVTLLSDIPVGLLEAACRRLIMTNKFLPAISEIVEASESLVGTADDSQRVREWDEAWAEIEKAMFATPWNHIPSFSRPEIAIAVRNYGWKTLQQSLAADMPTVRAQVRGMYENACKRAKERSSNEYVLGGNPKGLLQPSADKPQGLTSVQATLAQIGAAHAEGSG